MLDLPLGRFVEFSTLEQAHFLDESWMFAQWIVPKGFDCLAGRVKIGQLRLPVSVDSKLQLF
jgi:hypothetical protein